MTTLLLTIYVLAALRMAWWLIEVAVYALFALWYWGTQFTDRPYG